MKKFPLWLISLISIISQIIICLVSINFTLEKTGDYEGAAVATGFIFIILIINIIVLGIENTVYSLEDYPKKITRILSWIIIALSVGISILFIFIRINNAFVDFFKFIYETIFGIIFVQGSVIITSIFALIYSHKK